MDRGMPRSRKFDRSCSDETDRTKPSHRVRKIAESLPCEQSGLQTGRCPGADALASRVRDRVGQRGREQRLIEVVAIEVRLDIDAGTHGTCLLDAAPGSFDHPAFSADRNTVGQQPREREVTDVIGDLPITERSPDAVVDHLKLIGNRWVVEGHRAGKEPVARDSMCIAGDGGKDRAGDRCGDSGADRYAHPDVLFRYWRAASLAARRLRSRSASWRR